MSNLSLLLERSADAHPERTAVVAGSSRWTYAEIEAAANQVANLLAERGVGRGDRIALVCPNVPHFSIAYFGILKVGATVVPLNVLLKSHEMAYHLEDSGAVAVFAFEGDADLPVGETAWEAFAATATCAHFFVMTSGSGAGSPIAGAETLADAVEGQPTTFDSVDVSDEDTAVILYTSGTTGRPKGAELRHRNMRENALAGEGLFGETEQRPDTYLCVLPLFHSFGQTCIQNAAFAFAGTVVMQPRFEARAALELMQRERVTFFAGVPTMYWGLLGVVESGEGVPRVPTSLRVAISGGSALPVEIHRQFKERFGLSILEGYGLSETSPVASFGRLGEEPRVGSVGRPIPGVEMRLIRDDWSEVEGADAIGEIAIRGHCVMKGYYRRLEATSQALNDGWFRSGDLGRKDEDGFYYIVDRSKDMIIRGGYNVYPRELEEVLISHPAVSLVAVIGVPHPKHGEEIKAVVVRNPGDPTTEEELRAWGKEQFASYKYPRIVEFREALPMTSTGKILKRQLLDT